MSRPARLPTPITPLAPLPPGKAEALAADTNLIAAQYAQVAAEWGDGLPYDRDRIVGEVRFYLGQSAEAMLEAGRRLILLKEREPHGDWIEICERRIGIGRRAAQVMMQAAVKFCLSSPKAQAPALLGMGKTKLIELMILDDEPLAALAEGGTVAGLSLDDIDRMTTRELRAALREARATGAAKDQVLADKGAVVDKLSTEVQRLRMDKVNGPQVARAEPDRYRAGLINDLGRCQILAEAALRSLERVIDALGEHYRDNGGEPSHEAISGAVGQVMAVLDDICTRRDIRPPTGRMPYQDIWDAVNEDLARQEDAQLDS